MADVEILNVNAPYTIADSTARAAAAAVQSAVDNIKTGEDGTVYETAGDAVREQAFINGLNLKTTNITEKPFGIWQKGTLEYVTAGRPIQYSTGVYENTRKVTSYIYDLNGAIMLNVDSPYQIRVVTVATAAGENVVGAATAWAREIKLFEAGRYIVIFRDQDDTDISGLDPAAIIRVRYAPAITFTHIINAEMERGSIESDSGAIYNAKKASYTIRARQSRPVKMLEEGFLIISFDTEEAAHISAATAYVYNGASLTRSVSLDTSGVNLLQLYKGRSIKVGVVFNGTEYDISTLSIKSNVPIKEIYNEDILYGTQRALAFNYKVSDGVYTSGRLLLPPNYQSDGTPVPLIVFAHGSNGILTWTADMCAVGANDYYEYYKYLTDEGFAIFDCYPWTSKYDAIGTGVYNNFALPNCKNAYLSGIRYVCSRFNVDINNVSMICKSQGGHIGEWAMVQTEIPFKAIALYAPSNTLANPINQTVLIGRSVRRVFTQLFTFTGTSSDIETFISNGNYTDETVKKVIDDNKDIFVGLSPFMQGVHGIVDYATAFEWTFQMTNIKPEYMADLPEWDEIYTSGQSVIINHPELSKYATPAIKYWGAFDDDAVSNYVNYTIYQWLKNGGSDVQFRILPNGTGGHFAMDSDPAALKESGTTRLGISFTDIPTAYVETAHFFIDKMTMST